MKKTGIHITHEAVQKIGGIGSVISGLLTADSYQYHFSESLLYAPLFNYDGNAETRLGINSTLLYSSHDHIEDPHFHKIFKPIEKKYHVKIFYGKKKITCDLNPQISQTVDIILVDVFHIKTDIKNIFKFQVWKEFGIQSELYPIWDYEQYLLIGIVYPDILSALYGPTEKVHFAHEYMGIPSLYSILLLQKENIAANDITIFYAHEVATARSVVESHAGHDISFYNIMRHDMKNNISLEQEFGSQKSNYRHELIKTADRFSYIFAVGDLVKQEYLYLNPTVPEDKIKIVYNGIQVKQSSYKEKTISRNIINSYCDTLFNFTPDYIFTHVTRLLSSKGLWRDIKILQHLDAYFEKHNLKGIYILLSTLLANGRPAEEIHRLEREYGWPLLHFKRWPDLEGYEQQVYDSIALFNAKSKRIKGVFLNQFGFNRINCGERMPAEADLLKLRMASDLEFGCSVYEPFGIAQLETAPYAGLPVLSDACGSAYLLKKVFENHPDMYNIIEFTKLPANLPKQKEYFRNLSFSDRDHLEELIIKSATPTIFKQLQKIHNKPEYFFNSMNSLAMELSWNSIVKNNIIHYF